MKFKLLIVLVDDELADTVTQTARDKGATGCTVITNARGEGLKPAKTFFGLNLVGQRDVIMMLVEEHLSRQILEEISRVCEFEEKPGSGIAFLLDIEDAIGLKQQMKTIQSEIEDQI